MHENDRYLTPDKLAILAKTGDSDTQALVDEVAALRAERDELLHQIATTDTAEDLARKVERMRPVVEAAMAGANPSIETMVALRKYRAASSELSPGEDCPHTKGQGREWGRRCAECLAASSEQEATAPCGCTTHFGLLTQHGKGCTDVE